MMKMAPTAAASGESCMVVAYCLTCVSIFLFAHDKHCAYPSMSLFNSSNMNSGKRWFGILVLVAGVLIAERMIRNWYATKYAVTASTAPTASAVSTEAQTDMPPPAEYQVEAEQVATNNNAMRVAPADDGMGPNVSNASATAVSPENRVEPETVEELRSAAAKLPFSPSASNDDDYGGLDLRARARLQVEDAARIQIAAKLPNVKDRSAGGGKQVSGMRRMFNDPVTLPRTTDPYVNLPPPPNRDFFRLGEQSLRTAEADRFNVDKTNARYHHPDANATAFTNGDIMTEHMRITSAQRPPMYPTQSLRVAAPDPRLPVADRFAELERGMNNKMETVFRPEFFPSPYVNPEAMTNFDRGATVVQPSIGPPNRRGEETNPNYALFQQRQPINTLPYSADFKNDNVNLINEQHKFSQSMSKPIVGREMALTNVIRENTAMARDLMHLELRNERTMPPGGLVGNPNANAPVLGGGVGFNGASDSAFERARVLPGISNSTELTQRLANKPRLNPSARQSTAFMESGTLRDTHSTPVSISTTEPKTRLIVQSETEFEKQTISARPDDVDRMTAYQIKPLPDAYQRDDYNQRREMDLVVPPRMSPAITRSEFYENRPPVGELTGLRATRT